MKTLRQHIENQTQSCQAVVEGSCQVTFGDLSGSVIRCQGLSPTSGIVLRLRSVADTLRALAALDGVVGSVFLAPSTLTDEVVWDLASTSGCKIILADDSLDEVPAKFKAVQIRDVLTTGEQQGAGSTETNWLMCTTGTTGSPKVVRHTLESLTRTTKIGAGTGADRRWGLLYDCSRFAGLQVTLQSLFSGATLIVPDLKSELISQVGMLSREGCSHLSATPTLWRKLQMIPAADKLPLRQVTLGGEIADQKLLNSLIARYPQARVCHIYASTEAGVGFSVTDGQEGFPTRYLGQGPGDTEIEIRDGRLFVRNSRIVQSYVGTSVSFVTEDGFVDTGDLVEIRADRVRFLGRDSGAINVGGSKVHPEEVEHVLLQHGGVAEVHVFARASSFTGSLVAADIVASSPVADWKTLQADLRIHCRDSLPRHAVPAFFGLVEKIDINASGKLCRRAG